MRLQVDNVSVLIFLSSLFNLARGLSVNNITCSGSSLLDFRVEGCIEQPCKIRKGEPLPFEVDLRFERPREIADRVYFNVYLPKYAKPPAVHGSTLLTATCDQGNLGFSCPISAGVPYTLRSKLLIDSDAECTANCERIGVNGTSLRETKWRWTISNSNQKSKRNKQGQVFRKPYAVCHFSLSVNIVE